MNTARVTWFGSEGKLHLQLRRFPAGKEVKCRLDDITPPERRRYRDQLLVRRCDGALINVGALVPEDAVFAAIEENSVVDDGHTGFFVNLPRGYGLIDNAKTNELNLIPAGDVPAMTEPGVDEEEEVGDDETAVEEPVAEETLETETKVAEALRSENDLSEGVSKVGFVPDEDLVKEPKAEKRKGKKRRGKKREEDLVEDLMGD